MCVQKVVFLCLARKRLYFDDLKLDVYANLFRFVLFFFETHCEKKENNSYCNRVYFRKKLTGLESKSHCRESPPRSGEKPPDPCRLLRSSTTPPLWP